MSHTAGVNHFYEYGGSCQKQQRLSQNISSPAKGSCREGQGAYSSLDKSPAQAPVLLQDQAAVQFEKFTEKDDLVASECGTEYPESEGSLEEDLGALSAEPIPRYLSSPPYNLAYPGQTPIDHSNYTPKEVAQTSNQRGLSSEDRGEHDLKKVSESMGQPNGGQQKPAEQIEEGGKQTGTEQGLQLQETPFSATQYPVLEETSALEATEQLRESQRASASPEVSKFWNAPALEEGRGAQAGAQQCPTGRSSPTPSQPCKGTENSQIGAKEKPQNGTAAIRDAEGKEAAATQYPDIEEVELIGLPIETQQIGRGGKKDPVVSTTADGRGPFEGEDAGPTCTQYPNLDDEDFDLDLPVEHPSINREGNSQGNHPKGSLPGGGMGLEAERGEDQEPAATQYPDIDEEDFTDLVTSRPEVAAPSGAMDRDEREPDAYSDFDAELDDFLAEQVGPWISSQLSIKLVCKEEPTST